MSKTIRNVAIVDDDPSLLKALKRLLSTRSLIADVYDSGPQFLASLAKRMPDCLILDLQMPDMTGLELQQKLASRGIRIPTIFITAHSDAATRGRCEATGAVAFLAKPVADDALFAAIEVAGGGAAQSC